MFIEGFFIYYINVDGYKYMIGCVYTLFKPNI